MDSVQQLTIIAAVDSNNALGNKGALLFKHAGDLAHFKNVTTGNILIMGRKTHESIGKVLPNRLSIVITRNNSYENCKDVIIARSINEALSIASYFSDKEVFVIGGGEIYKEALPHVNKILLTKFRDAAKEADTFFPDVPEDFKLKITKYLDQNAKIEWYFKTK